MADTDDPVATVLNTPELLEHILLQLDERTLLLSQRVSRTFNANIGGSVKLQRKLFFQLEPVVDPPAHADSAKGDAGSSTKPRFNLLLKLSLTTSNTLKRGGTCPYIRVSERQERLSSSRPKRAQHFRYMDASTTDRGGSWLKMYAVQPTTTGPTHQLKFGAVTAREGGWLAMWPLESGKSMTIGEMLEIWEAETEVMKAQLSKEKKAGKRRKAG